MELSWQNKENVSPISAEEEESFTCSRLREDEIVPVSGNNTPLPFTKSSLHQQIDLTKDTESNKDDGKETVLASQIWKLDAVEEGEPSSSNTSPLHIAEEEESIPECKLSEDELVPVSENTTPLSFVSSSFHPLIDLTGSIVNNKDGRKEPVLVVPIQKFDTTEEEEPSSCNTSPFPVGNSFRQQVEVPDRSSEEEEEVDNDEKEAEFKLGVQFRKLVKQLAKNQNLQKMFGANLPDGGALLRNQETLIKQRMMKLRGYIPSQEELAAALTSKEEDDGAYQPKVPVKQRLFGVTETRALTAMTVQHLHSSMANCPTEDDLADQPSALRTNLYPHQCRALAWLLWRESQIPSGGILADDMGLGKTLTMLSLILADPGSDDKEFINRPSEGSGLIPTHGTLVVVPASLLHMWKCQITDHVEAGRLRVHIYHGSSRTKDPRRLQLYDVVVTTYTIVGIEAGSIKGTESLNTKKSKRTASCNTVFQLHWKRVILDEAHTIRNPKTALSIGCCHLTADHRWAMTGTPIQNKLQDFYSLVKFLRLAPFNDLRTWKDTIERRSIGMERLRTMVALLVLRRTKDEVELGKEDELPGKTTITHDISLTPEEQAVYDILFSESRGYFQRHLAQQDGDSCFPDDSSPQSQQLEKLDPPVAQIVQRILRSLHVDDTKTTHASVLVMLLRLRQCCSHLSLLSSKLKSSVLDDNLDLAMGALSLDDCDTYMPVFDFAVPRQFKQDAASSKVKAVIDLLFAVITEDKEGERPHKSVVVSQWTAMLDVIEHHLNAANIMCARIDGKVPPKLRQGVVELFNTAESNPRVMLLSLQAGGVGLNLIGGNHVFIIDLHWNPQLELQASDRCHRFGQIRDVVVHRFVTKGTVEAVIIHLQKKKLLLAEEALSSASQKGRKRRTNLTLEDLKELFAID